MMDAPPHDSHEEEGKEEQVPPPVPSIVNTLSDPPVPDEEISDSESESDSVESADSMTFDEIHASSSQQQNLISSFTEIAVGQTTETAIQFLETTNWNLVKAVNLFLVGSHTTALPPTLKFLFQGSFDEAKSTSSQRNLWLLVNLQSTKEHACHSLNLDLWSNEAVSQALEPSFILWQVYDVTTQGQKISTFYRIDSAPPVVLLIDPITGFKMRSWSGVIDAQSFVEDLKKYMVSGPREHIASLTRKKTLETEMACNESNQTSDDHLVTPSLGSELEEVETCSTSNHIDHVVADTDVFETIETKTLPTHEEEEETCIEFPVLTEEPKEDCDKSLVCSLCVRFPDGRRKQRKFLKSEPIQLLWSFCDSQIVESEKKAFKLVQAIPGASKTLDYGVNATFEQSGLANSMVSVAWD